MAGNYRETRKQELRERIVDAGEIERREKKNRKRRKSRKRSGLLAVLFLAAAGMLLAGNYLLRRGYRSFSVSWSTEYKLSGGSGDSGYESYELYGDGFLRLTRDGASYVDSAGKTVWNQAYEMNAPFASVNGDYAAIADRGKTTLYIMNAGGVTGEAETSLPIKKLAVSQTGVVYALLEDSAASYIAVFSREGTALDISIKSVLEGDGYPVDIAVSPDGTELIASFAYLERGSIQNKVIFYNLSEVGQSAGANRVVGGFTEDFRGYLSGRVRFSDNTYAQAFYDGGIAFFSTKLLTSPELLVNVRIEQTIRSIAYSGDYIAVITENGEPAQQSGGEETAGEGRPGAEKSETEKTGTEKESNSALTGETAPYRLMLFRENGQKVFEREFGFAYTELVLDKKAILLYHGDALQMYDLKGRLRYEGQMEAPILKARMLSGSELLPAAELMVSSEGRIQRVKLR